MFRSSPRGFTLIELLVVIALITVIMAFAVPALTRAIDSAKIAKDLGTLRQIGVALQTYLNDKDNVLPVINAAPGIGTDLSPVIYPRYTSSTRRGFQSPFDKRSASETDNAPVSYGINQNIYSLINGNITNVVSPSSTILMAPNYNGNPAVSASWTGKTGAAPYVPNLQAGGGGGMTTGPQRNGAQINALFCDLHAETMTFGPVNNPASGSFKDTTTPLGQKHWDPTK